MSDTDSDERPTGPARILPESSILELEDYLAMQDALGDETQFRVLYALKRTGDAHPSDLAEILDANRDHVASSLAELTDVGLVENWIWNEPGNDGVDSTYRVSALGEGLLEDGIESLLQGEWDARERYA
ncbi:winged helix-turn-helix domain-containing protein [Halorussus caseinilyticus]|uniref:ArsR family transcriptional regulator n=1 Tax=Halorussus caseinilyticus TaxID=3034025 RepID=A0ABD5WLR7_9EURY|nr:winged helix-turn-helix domain-containing protein [Halorussus sp. DT72]